MDKIERVARALCLARGRAPDEDSGKGKLRAVPLDGSSGGFAQARDPAPNWQDFGRDARVFVAAYEAVNE